LDGKVHKLGKINFTFDPTNYKKSWKMVSPDGRMDLKFTPFFERVAKTDAVILKSEVHQMFGRYNRLGGERSRREDHRKRPGGMG
jgi:hypothetical protein